MFDSLRCMIIIVVLLPHLGSSTEDTEEAMAVMAVQNILAVLDGIPMPSEVFF